MTENLSAVAPGGVTFGALALDSFYCLVPVACRVSPPLSRAPEPPAAAPRPSDAAFFAGARDWTVTETAERLVERVARVYDAPQPAALAAAVRAAAAEHCVTGESLVRSPDAREMAVSLLGDWGGRLGVVVSVTSFIGNVRRFAAQQ